MHSQDTSDSVVQFFFVGPGKCGTSWIYNFVRRHELASVPNLKEPHIVDLPSRAQNKALLALYKTDGPRCDFSNTYSHDIANPAKIVAHNRNARAIITIRRPSQRIVSQYAYYQRTRTSNETLAEYLDRGDDLDMIGRSDYRPIINRYLEHLTPANVLVLPLELLREDAQAYADRLATFLGGPAPTLGEDDYTAVRPASAARSRVLAALGKRVAIQLRAGRYYGALSRLKESSLINRSLFREGVDLPEPDFGRANARVRALDVAYPAVVEEFCDLPGKGLNL